jgi:hypothetical protein
LFGQELPEVAAREEGDEEELLLIAVEGEVGIDDDGGLVEGTDVDCTVELFLEHEVHLSFLHILPLHSLEVLRLHLLLEVTILADIVFVECPIEEVVVGEEDVGASGFDVLFVPEVGLGGEVVA